MKSYFYIFIILLLFSEINYLLDIWVIEELYLKYKLDKIVENYYKFWGKEVLIYD